MSRKFLRVAKVGGSLFSFKELPMALRCWLDAQPGVSILVAGGGPFADAVREVSATFALDDATAHRLAIGGMQGSAELLGALLPESPLIHSLADVFERLPSHGAVVLNPAKILNQPECQLPQSWDVTSDSIAATNCGKRFTVLVALLESSHSGKIDSLPRLSERISPSIAIVSVIQK